MGSEMCIRDSSRHLTSLEKSSCELRNQVLSQQHDEKMLVTLEQVISRRDEMFGKYLWIYDGIETLVTSKRLSTSLSSPKQVYTRLDAINKISKGSQQEILLEDFKDVYAVELVSEV